MEVKGLLFYCKFSCFLYTYLDTQVMFTLKKMFFLDKFFVVHGKMAKFNWILSSLLLLPELGPVTFVK